MSAQHIAKALPDVPPGTAAERHFLRGGKFVMSSDEPCAVGDVVRVGSFDAVLEVRFRVVGPATYADALANRPEEFLGTPCEDDCAYYYFVEPCD